MNDEELIKIRQKYYKLKNMIQNCYSLNGNKCIYCHRNKSCKEYNESLKLKEIIDLETNNRS